MPNTKTKTEAKTVELKYTRTVLLSGIEKSGKLYEKQAELKRQATKEIASPFDAERKKLQQSGLVQAMLAVQLSCTRNHKIEVNATLAKSFNYGPQERKQLSMALNSPELAALIKDVKTPQEALEILGKAGLAKSGHVTKSALIKWIEAVRKEAKEDDNTVQEELDTFRDEHLEEIIQDVKKANPLREADKLYKKIITLLKSSHYEEKEQKGLLLVIANKMKSIEEAVANEEKRKEEKESKKK